MLGPSHHFERPYRRKTTEDYLSDFAASTTPVKLLDTSRSLEDEFNGTTKVVPTVELVDMLLEKLVIRSDFAATNEQPAIFRNLSESLNTLLSQQTGKEKDPTPPKLALDQTVVDRLWKAFDSGKASPHHPDYAADTFRTLETFFKAYPEHSNHPESYKRLVKYLTGPTPLYPRIIAFEALKKMTWMHPELADLPTGVPLPASRQETALQQSAQEVTNPEPSPLSLIDIAQTIALSPDPWGDGKPLDKRFVGIYSGRHPLAERASYLMINLWQKRPQDRAETTIRKIAFMPTDRPHHAAHKFHGLTFLFSFITQEGEKALTPPIERAMKKVYASLDHLETIQQNNPDQVRLPSPTKLREAMREHFPSLHLGPCAPEDETGKASQPQAAYTR
ncbi:MAG: hypothetical protein AB7E52_02340 [Bdellovibrionales bacterium]